MSMLKGLLVVLCMALTSAPIAASAAGKPAAAQHRVVMTIPVAPGDAPRSAAELDEDVRRYGELESKSKGLGKYEGGYWYYIVTPLGLVLIIVVIWLLL